MKHFSSFVRASLAVAVIVCGVACESTNDTRPKKKVVTAEQFDARNGDVSGLPWNRPRANESGSGMGRMMPQSR